jgi:hypothetical protein
MRQGLPQTASFSPPIVWERTRRAFGVVLFFAVLSPMFVLSHVMASPDEAAKPHGWALKGMLLLSAVVLPLLAMWVMAICFRGAERLSFEIKHGDLIVHTLLRTYTLPLRGATVRRTDARLTWRLAGTGLPGLYTGLYVLGEQRARAWATQREGGVVIDGEKRWFITPEDSEGFLAAAREHGANVQ